MKILTGKNVFQDEIHFPNQQQGGYLNGGVRFDK